MTKNFKITFEIAGREVYQISAEDEFEAIEHVIQGKGRMIERETRLDDFLNPTVEELYDL
jgi:hypothetical protein